jgi:hypothetical protein
MDLKKIVRMEPQEHNFIIWMASIDFPPQDIH